MFRAKNVRGVQISAERLVGFLATCPTVEFVGSSNKRDSGREQQQPNQMEHVLRKNVVTRFCLILLRGRLLVDYDGDGAKGT